MFAAGYAYLHRPPTLTDKDTIVLADFDNKTGDPVFDDTLRQGLSVELQQSPFLSLISDQQSSNAGADGTAERGAADFGTGSANLRANGKCGGSGRLDRQLGSQYVLGLRARHCNTGNILDQEQTEAARREDVLNSLSERRFACSQNGGIAPARLVQVRTRPRH